MRERQELSLSGTFVPILLLPWDKLGPLGSDFTHNILTNPIYAGAYAFGRTTSKVSVEQGRKRVRRGVHRPMAEWDVLIKDHHEAYITWDEFERNQRVIANNATGKGRQLPGRRADLRREWREIP